MSKIMDKKVNISHSEYLRLKMLDERFSDFLKYMENIVDIKQARQDVKKKKVISQERLFKKLGF